jgi:hypothetical protein
MSGYYPWGPHGPQSSPTEVTPNPTSAYVPPPEAPSYSDPVSYSGGGGGYSGGSATGGGYAGSAAGYSGPPRKSYAVAVVLSAIFGPLGLFYANAKAAKILLALVAANVVWQVFSTPLLVINRAGGFLSFIGSSEALSWAWSLATFASVVLSVLGVRSFRKALDATK